MGLVFWGTFIATASLTLGVGNVAARAVRAKRRALPATSTSPALDACINDIDRPLSELVQLAEQAAIDELKPKTTWQQVDGKWREVNGVWKKTAAALHQHRTVSDTPRIDYTERWLQTMSAIGAPVIYRHAAPLGPQWYDVPEYGLNTSSDVEPSSLQFQNSANLQMQFGHQGRTNATP